MKPKKDINHFERGAEAFHRIIKDRQTVSSISDLRWTERLTLKYWYWFDQDRYRQFNKGYLLTGDAIEVFEKIKKYHK